jgi:hypothetical protein
LPEANDHCDSAPPTTPGPKTRAGVATCRKRMIIATRPTYDPGPKTRAGFATCRKRTIIATRPRLRPPARRPGRALQLAESERSLRLGPAYDPGPKTRAGVATCRKRTIIATRGATEASDTLPEVHDCDLWRGWRQLHPDVLRLSPYRSAIFSLRTRTFARAAFVSPPWQADRDAEGSASFSGNRAPPRAAVVSPPWFSEPHLQVQCDEFPRFEFACGVHPTGGLRPPLLVGDASATGIMRIPAASSTGTSLRS